MTAHDSVVPVTRFLLAAQNKIVGNSGAQDDSNARSNWLADQLVLLRHGERQDHAARAWKGSTHLPVYDPPLSRAGRMQVLETALEYRAMRLERTIEQRNLGLFSYLLLSPFHRCVETTVIMNVVAFDGKLALFVDPQLSEWQSSKVYRTTPTIAGCYTVRHKSTRSHAAMQLRFSPQQAALRASLEPFFRGILTHLQTSEGRSESGVGAEERETAAHDHVVEKFNLTAAVAQGWLAGVQRWLQRHPTLPVWTSQTVHHDICRAIVGDADEPRPSESGTPCAPADPRRPRSHQAGATPTARRLRRRRPPPPHRHSRSVSARRRLRSVWTASPQRVRV